MDKKLKSRLKLKKRNLNPVTSYIILTFIVVVFSGILSLFNFQTTYNVVDGAKVEMTQITTSIFNLFSFDGLKYIVGNATKNFIAFAPFRCF